MINRPADARRFFHARKAGYNSVWKSNPACCAACRELNGQTLRGNFRPPLHAGCSCAVALGERSRDAEVDYEALAASRKQTLIDHPELALPNAEHATAADAKFTGYLFNANNPDGWAKGIAISSRLGYNKDNWQELRSEILAAAQLYPAYEKGMAVVEGVPTEKKYEQNVILEGIKGRPANAKIGWATSDASTHMTTVHIEEIKKNETDL